MKTQSGRPLPVISRVITPFIGATTPLTLSFVRPFMGILQSIYNDRLGAHFASPREFATRAPDTNLLTPFAVERRLGLSHVRYFDRSRLPNQCFNSRKSVTWFSLGCSFFPGKRSVLHSRSKEGGLAEINPFFSFVQPKNNKAKRKTTSEIADWTKNLVQVSLPSGKKSPRGDLAIPAIFRIGYSFP